MHMKKIITLFFLVLSMNGMAQIDSSKVKKFSYGTSRFDKKFLFGASFNNGWSRYLEFEDEEVFTKPDLGLYLKAEYYFSSRIGLAFMVGHQQLGTGIITPDSDPGIFGSPDSTYRLRLRTNNISMPITIQFRTAKEIFPNGKLSGGIGIAPKIVYDAKSIFHSIEDGFHEKIDITAQFTKLDYPVRLNFGVDFNAGNSCLFRVNFLAEYGFVKMYSNSVTNSLSGRNILFGFDFDFLF